MKFRLWEIIVLISLFTVAIVFGLLNPLWSGKVYFTTSAIILFIGFFINNRIYYINYLRNQYDNGLETYFAELYNNNLITKEQFYQRDERNINGYYKDFRRVKLINLFIITGLIVVSISIILYLFW